MNYVCFLVARAVLAQTVIDPTPGTQAELELVVVEDGVPVPGATVLVDGEQIGTTDAQGALIALIPSGRTQLEVRRDADVVLSLDLLTDESELVLIIATLRPGEPPELLIENSGRQSVLADERKNDMPAVGGDVELERNAEAKEPGALVGTIVSAEDQEPVARAKVFFSGITIEVVTDDNGRFEAELSAGTYSVSVVHPRFSSQTLESIRVIPSREVTLRIELTPAGIRLQDYVVTAPYVEGSVASVIEQQREASGVSDILGAAQISATGDSNAAEALTRVTGLTVEDGKFVLIRGQPSRFTLALFNGSPLPSPEPLQRVVPLDLFPTGVLEGIQVQKSYSPDVPGAFGAGLVQLNTRGVPADAFFKVALNAGYNTITTFEDGFDYEGGSLDWLGFDDGARALPDEVVAATQDGTVSLRGEEAIAVAPAFPNNLATMTRSLPPNFGIGISSGGSIDLPRGGSFGVLGTASFSTQWQQQERIQRDFAVVAGPELDTRTDLVESRTDNVATLSSLLTLAAEWDNHELQLNTFFVNQAQQRTQFTTGREIGSNVFDIRRTLLSWIERLLVAEQILGEHNFGFFQIEYRGLVSQARRDAPDRRTYEYSATRFDPTFIVREPNGLVREYSFVTDNQYSFGIDLTTDYFAQDDSWFRIKPKFGVALDRATRTAGAQQFLWLPDTLENLDEPNPEILFAPSQTGNTLRFEDLSARGADDYEAESDIFGFYGMLDVELGSLARIVAGVRQETADFQVDTFQASQVDTEIVSSNFNQSELLPSAALTVFPVDEVQIRAAYGRTTSRPTFNELTPSFFFDPDSDQQFIGNPNLGPTLIDGYDFRAEWYPSTTESVTAGVFLKDYTDPLERTFRAQGGGGQVATFQNAESADVRGFEVGGRFEFARLRHWFSFVPEVLDLVYLSSNVAFLDSTVTLDDQGIAVDSERTLEGQADVVFNAQLGLDGEEHELTLAFNHVGERLARVGLRNQPNIIQQPINVLDLNYTWHITEKIDLKASGGNLLNTTVSLTQQLDGQSPEVFREFQNGRSLSIGLSYTFDGASRSSPTVNLPVRGPAQ